MRHISARPEQSQLPSQHQSPAATSIPVAFIASGEANGKPVGLGGFMTIAPRGMKYLPPCASIEEAREEIRDRSLYEGEPGWKILELDDNGDPIGESAAADADLFSGAAQ
ncbi:hypothetical protein [Paraburkholderia sp. GAS42]|uniref:hypothetical protein n=1 Tax=Paraburkholderia sp. GAS42 TaxID=3035135 RepID=UPI003D239B26